MTSYNITAEQVDAMFNVAIELAENHCSNWTPLDTSFSSNPDQRR